MTNLFHKADEQNRKAARVLQGLTPEPRQPSPVPQYANPERIWVKMFSYRDAVVTQSPTLDGTEYVRADIVRPSPTVEAEKIAKKIADQLFVAGSGQEGDHLQIVTGTPPNDVYLAGWCKKAVVDVIAAALKEHQ